MPKLPKIRWKTLPAGPRWLVYGVLLLVGIAVIALGVKNGTIPFKSVVLQLIVLLAMFVGILVALIERIKEIDGGEEDDARNY